jgi:hypothetical protein
MTRLELVAHLCQSLPKLNLSPLCVYCLVAPGLEGTTNSVTIQAQTRRGVRVCQRALSRLCTEGHLQICTNLNTPNNHATNYKLTKQGQALVKELLKL